MIGRFLHRIKSSENYSDILKGGAFVFILKVFTAAVSFALTLLIVNRIGASEAGYYFFIISFLLFLSSMATFGLTNGVLKLASVNSAHGRYLSRLLSKSCIFVLMGCFLLAVLFFVYKEFNGWHGLDHQIIDGYLEYILLALYPFSIMFIFSSYFQAQKKLFLSMLMLNLGYQSIMLLFVLTTESLVLDTLLLFFLASLFILLLIALLVFRFFSGGEFSLQGGPTFSFMLSLSFPMMLANLISQINIFAGQFLLSIYATTEDVALYSVSARIAALMSFLVVAVNRISAPKFAVLYGTGEIDELRGVVLFSNRLLFAFCLPMLLLALFFGREILALFGSDFERAYGLLVLLVLGQFIASISGTVVFLLQMTGQEKGLRNAVAISACLSLLAGWWLIPVYGVLGAGIMTFLGLVIINLLSCFRAYKVLNINPLKIF